VYRVRVTSTVVRARWRCWIPKDTLSVPVERNPCIVYLRRLSRRPNSIQMPPPGRNDCGPGGRRGTIPVVGVSGRGGRARSGASPDPKPGPRRLLRSAGAGLHAPLTPGRGRRDERGPGAWALVGARLAGCWLALRLGTRARSCPQALVGQALVGARLAGYQREDHRRPLT
jgi:hypothetical protein